MTDRPSAAQHPCSLLPVPFSTSQDRVESSPEQMARCTAHAERLSRESGTRTRVVGWYHSHPHITVLPSHVDVRTQVGGAAGAGQQSLPAAAHLHDTNAAAT